MADVVMKVDDLDGTPIPPGEGGSVSFGFLGRHFEIDLTFEHEEELAKLLDPYIKKAREVSTPAAAAGGTEETRAQLLQAEARRNLEAGKKPYDTVAARAWLQEQGIEYNQMGPLKREFRVLYEKHYGLPSYDTAPQHPAKS